MRIGIMLWREKTMSQREGEAAGGRSSSRRKEMESSAHTWDGLHKESWTIGF